MAPEIIRGKSGHGKVRTAVLLSHQMFQPSHTLNAKLLSTYTSLLNTVSSLLYPPKDCSGVLKCRIDGVYCGLAINFDISLSCLWWMLPIMRLRTKTHKCIRMAASSVLLLYLWHLVSFVIVMLLARVSFWAASWEMKHSLAIIAVCVLQSAWLFIHAKACQTIDLKT